MIHCFFLIDGGLAAPAPRTTAAGKLLAPTWDWHWHSSMSEWTRDSGREVVRREKKMGFSRLYIVVNLPGGPVFSSPATARAPGSFYEKNIRNLGPDINASVAQICREEGMEVIAIFKPYENGGAFSVPDGAVPDAALGFREKTVGGENLFFDSFAGAHPEMRVARKDDYDADDYNLPITRIEAVFSLDPYQAAHTALGYKARHDYLAWLSANDAAVRATHGYAPSGMTARLPLPSGSVPMPKVSLLVSRDNGEYTPYKGGFSHEYKLEHRDIRDANGIVIGKNKRCNVLSLTGLNIGAEYPYVALMLENSFGMRTIPFSMIRWFSGGKELKLTATTRVRRLRGAPGEWLRQDVPDESMAKYQMDFTLGAGGRVRVQERDNYTMTPADEVVANFYKTGFFFSWFGVGHNGDGWRVSPVHGLARGKAPFMGGALCEAYSETRRYWLDCVRQLLDAGFDGVDIRLQCHSSMVTDYMNYGFNAPVVARYRELYGTDMNSIPMTPEVYLRVMKIRGDYFMGFLEEAAALVRGRGARFLVHLKDAHENPLCDSDWDQLCHWTMPKISLDWRRCVELADEITIKDYYYKQYKPALAGGAKDYAATLGKKVWVHCYYGQGDGYDETFLRSVEKDKRVSGILLYDTVSPKIDPETRALLGKLQYADRGVR
jgi:hypothetical protein